MYRNERNSEQNQVTMNDATERSADSSYESNRNDVANERQLKAQELAEDMMIHDVRNPLSSIISIADMLSTRELSEDDLLWIERITALGHRALPGAEKHPRAMPRWNGGTTNWKPLRLICLRLFGRRLIN